MKNSMWWRLGLVVAVLAAWTVYMFPVKDRDFFATFEALAQPRLEKAQKEGTVASKQAVENFRALMSAARAKVNNDPKVAPYIAIRQIASGKESLPRLTLNEFVPVPGLAVASNNAVLEYARHQASGRFRWGLDIRGGTEFVIGFDAKDVPAGRNVTDVRDQILEILRKRVDAQGIVEPEIKPVSDTAISLRMPSVSENDKESIRDLIQKTAKLSFHLVHPDSDRLANEYAASRGMMVAPAGYQYQEEEVEHGGELRIDRYFIKTRAESVRGEDVVNAGARPRDLGGYEVDLQFNARGAKAFGEVTSENVKQRMAIVLDGKIYSAPTIQDAIWGGNAQITGQFTPEEAQQLANVLKSGNLPVKIKIDSEFGTDPTLGADSIKAGITAAVVGSIAVVLFMLIYYHLSGVNAIIALIANMVLVVGSMTILGSTFTMPGIAGIVLTVGMAVDANILIFERIREELAAGKNIESAVHAGFDRAFLTIFDSNLTTLITALVLLFCGTGSVKGFAITLSLGLIANVFTAVYFSRAIFDFKLRYFGLKKLTMLQLFKKPNLDILKIRYVTFVFSGILLTASLATLIIKGRACLSTDFVGGTTITYSHKAATPPDVSALRKVMDGLGQKESRIGYKFNSAQSAKMLEIMVPPAPEGKPEMPVETVTQTLQKQFPQAGFEQMQTYRVGGLVGKSFQMKALVAVFLSFLAIALYVAFRFEFAYGVASVVALIHDVIIATGFCIWFDRQISLTVLAALLTIIGYSINDTIVVFDRIREGFALRKGQTYAEVVKNSINETLSRTVLTASTVIIALLALFFLGGGAVNDFAFVMLVGTVFGTYSSVYMASAIIVSWHKRLPHHVISEEETRAPSAEAAGDV